MNPTKNWCHGLDYKYYSFIIIIIIIIIITENIKQWTCNKQKLNILPLPTPHPATNDKNSLIRTYNVWQPARSF